MTSDVDLTKIVAYHEAGHAVVIHEFGLEFEDVTIVPSGSTAGRALLVAGSLREWLSEAVITSYESCLTDIKIYIAYGGGEAERIYTGQPAMGDSEDLAKVEELLSQQTPSLSDQRKADIRRNALTTVSAILKKRWPAVAAIAEMLLSEKTLKYSQVKKIIDQKSKSKKRRPPR